MKKIIPFVVVLIVLISNLPVFSEENEMNIYIKEKANESDTQNYHGVQYEPKIGSYLGMYAEADSCVHNPKTAHPFYFEGVPKLTGKKHAMYMIYIPYSSMEFNFYRSHYKRAKKYHCGMHIALEPDKGLEVIKDDERLHRFAAQAKEAGIPIFLRFANEMNDPGNAWGKDIQLYKEKFRLVADVMHKKAPNVVMCWAPNDWGYKGFDDAIKWYPGDEYVDWVGVSSYPPYLKNGESKHHTKWTDRLRKVYDRYSGRKPIYLAEGAPIQNVEFEDTASMTAVAAKDLREFYDEVARRYPNVKAIFYWDSNEKYGAKRQCKISSNPVILEAYKNAISDHFFLTDINATSDVIYRDLKEYKGKVVEPKISELSAYVGNHSLKTHKVLYYINNQLMKEAVGSPYTFMIDFSNYEGEIISIKAESYDFDNKLIMSTNYDVEINFAGLLTREIAFKRFDKVKEEPLKIGHFTKDVRLVITNSITNECMDLTDKITDGLRVINNRSAIGLRDVSLMLDNVDVEWHNEHRAVIIKTADKELIYPINKAMMFNQEEIISLDTQVTIDPEISRSFLPIRSIAEALDYDVIWHEDTATIELKK